MKPYTGPLDRNKMSKWALKAYESWSQQGTRCKRRGMVRGYTSREFVTWWLHEMKRKPRWKCPTVSRIDHDKGYYFGNVRLEEKFDNICERNARCGNPGKSHRAVRAFDAKGKVLGTFPSKTVAARFFGVNPKTVYNHCHGRLRSHFKFGPRTGARAVRFEWAP